MNYYYKMMPSVVGNLTLIATSEGLVEVLWNFQTLDSFKQGPLSPDEHHPVVKKAERELIEYFEGRRKVFTVPLTPQGTTFQMKVWEALRSIPFGETRSYRQIAEQIGNAKAMRAVGAANGRNPIPIIVPCHRVIGASGDLVGFGGGLDVKKKLLALENCAVVDRREPELAL